jgi:hypothetical protein
VTDLTFSALRLKEKAILPLVSWVRGRAANGTKLARLSALGCKQNMGNGEAGAEQLLRAHVDKLV